MDEEKKKDVAVSIAAWADKHRVKHSTYTTTDRCVSSGVDGNGLHRTNTLVLA
jgi:transcription termination factor Rho